MKAIIKDRKSLKKLKNMLAMLFSVSLLGGAVTAQNTNVCIINADNKGNVTSMTVTNPTTSLGIEKSFFFEVDKNGAPTKGTITFNNGVDRELKVPEELNLMWQKFGGPQNFWDYNAKQGKTISYTSVNDISNPVFGKPSRVFIRDGKDFFGKIMRAPNQESVLLDVGATNPLPIDKALIREIQQFK